MVERPIKKSERQAIAKPDEPGEENLGAESSPFEAEFEASEAPPKRSVPRPLRAKDRPDKSEQSDSSDGPARSDRPDRSDRSDRPGRSDRSRDDGRGKGKGKGGRTEEQPKPGSLATMRGPRPAKFQPPVEEAPEVSEAPVVEDAVVDETETPVEAGSLE